MAYMKDIVVKFKFDSSKASKSFKRFETQMRIISNLYGGYKDEMNILEGVSGNYSIGKDMVVACSSTDDEKNNIVRCKFKFSSNIVIKLEIERSFLHSYSSGDRLQIILGKLNEKYESLKPIFTKTKDDINFLENSKYVIIEKAQDSFFEKIKSELRPSKSRPIKPEYIVKKKKEKKEIVDDSIARFEDILNDD